MIKNSFDSLNISNKLAVIFVLLLFMMGLGGAVGLYNGSQIARVTDSLYIDAFKRTQALSKMEKELLNFRQELFLHTVVSEHSSKAYLGTSLDEDRKKINRHLSEYKSLGTKGFDSLVALFEASLLEFWSVQSRTVELSVSGERKEALELIRGEGDIKFTATMSALKNLINEETGTAYDDYQAIKSFAGIIVTVTLVLTVLAIMLAAGLWFALTRAIVAPLRAIEESARKISRGDFKERIPVLTRDELGELAVEFNEMAQNVEEYYATLEKKVEQRTDELSLANEELLKKKKELEETNVELMSANQMKSQFLANVSHEFRTPLNSIIGFSELLKEANCGELNEKQTQYLEFIHSSGGTLLHLINNILDLSRIAAGNVELEVEDFSVKEVLVEVLGSVRPQAIERFITIKSRDVPASPVIRGDKAKFKQIMLNLLSNALKFNKDGGTVEVDWQIEEEPRGMVMEKYLVISVRDSGIGIRDEDKERIFMEFEQVDTSVSREYEGSGLGLALTEKLVELHKGTIRLESKFGEGSTFYVKLPQGTERIDMPSKRRAPVLREASEGSTVLIACETPDLNQLMSIYLSGGSYDVITAADGQELLDKARSTHPLAIFMGVTLSRKDGWEVLKELSSTKGCSDIPVVVLSSTDCKEMAYSLGAAGYLEKPVSKIKVMEVLDRLGANLGA